MAAFSDVSEANAFRRGLPNRHLMSAAGFGSS